MKRILLSCSALAAIAGGCSSTTSGYGFSDAGSDGATSIIIDAGGPDAKTTTKKDGGTVGRDAGDIDVVVEDATPPKKKDAGPPPVLPLCAPGTVTGFSPTWHPPQRTAGACTSTQIDALLDCLLDSAANQTTCQTILAASANQNCLACAVTDATASSYGAIVQGDGILSLNLAGCVALKSNNVTVTGCGAKYQALSECSSHACAASCPVTDDASFSDYVQCTTTAEAGVCTSYATPAQCIDALTQTGAAAVACDIAAGTFIDNAKAFTTIFCQ